MTYCNFFLILWLRFQIRRFNNVLTFSSFNTYTVKNILCYWSNCWTMKIVWCMFIKRRINSSEADTTHFPWSWSRFLKIFAICYWFWLIRIRCRFFKFWRDKLNCLSVVSVCLSVCLSVSNTQMKQQTKSV